VPSLYEVVILSCEFASHEQSGHGQLFHLCLLNFLFRVILLLFVWKRDDKRETKSPYS
jgi:hypothetical protein